MKTEVEAFMNLFFSLIFNRGKNSAYSYLSFHEVYTLLMKFNFSCANGCDNQRPPYLLSQRLAWGAAFSSCCFINDLETEILRNEKKKDLVVRSQHLPRK